MKTIINDLGSVKPSYPIEHLASPEQVLFLDIETTGFTAKSSNLYLIGCVYFADDEWHTIQWLAENYDEEVQVLNAFLEYCLNYSFIIHFNGNRFDLPYLTQKCEMYDIPFKFDDFKGVDLYKRIKPYKNFLKLENCNPERIYRRGYSLMTDTDGHIIRSVHAVQSGQHILTHLADGKIHSVAE